jgi:putative endonuclease
MILHTEKGKSGEQLAVAYLLEKKFRILFCNWRVSRYEIDIIAEKNDVIHFIEVKTRHSDDFGYPEQSVNRKKFKNLQKAARAFLNRFDEVMKIQFDILSIRILPGRAIEYFFIEDFYIY